MFDVRIQHDDFDVSQELAALRRGDAGVGAVCVFVGTVRDHNEGSGVASMELEPFPMSEANLIPFARSEYTTWQQFLSQSGIKLD